MELVKWGEWNYEKYLANPKEEKKRRKNKMGRKIRNDETVDLNENISTVEP